MPYAIAVVELAEGVRLVSGLRGVALAELAVGLALEVGFEKASDAVGLHYFRPPGG